MITLIGSISIMISQNFSIIFLALLIFFLRRRVFKNEILTFCKTIFMSLNALLLLI